MMPGTSEWLIILGIALLLFPKKLPQLGGSIGEFITNLRRGLDEPKKREPGLNTKSEPDTHN